MTNAVRHIFSVLIGLSCIACPAAAQLQLKPPDIPSRFYTDRLVAIEQQIDAFDKQFNEADKPTQLILESKKSLRLIARRLWLTGRAAGDNGSLAVMYGMTVEAAFDDFDKLIDPLPKRVIEAFNAGEKKAGDLAKLRRALDALKTFNEGASAPIQSAAARHVDAYLNQTLSPLAVVVEVLGEAEPMSTWAGESTEAGPAPRQITATDVAALRSRIDEAPLAEATRGEMRWLTEMMTRALDEPDLRPRVLSFYLKLSNLVDVAEAFEKAAWLDELTRHQFQSQAHTAVLLFKDAKTRDTADARFAQMSRMHGLLVVMNQLAEHEDVDMSKLRQAFMTAYRLVGNENSEQTADRLATMLGRIVNTALSQRAMERADKLPLDVRRAQQVLARQYATLERQTIAGLPTLLADPSQVTQPRWAQPVDQLEAVAADVRHLNRVPEWVERMARFNPHAARGLYKQLRLIADDLLNPATHTGASAALVELERQLSLFETLPYEAMLKDDQSVIAKMAGEYLADIRKELTVLRSQWAAAWAAGADPTPAGRNLLLLRRLMIGLHDGGQLLARADRLATLNRWAAWQMPVAAVAPMRNWLPGELEAAAQQAGDGDWAGLSATLDRIDKQGQVAWLIARLMEELGPAVERLPDGTAGMLSQTLYPPPSRTLGVDHRLDLARLCVTLAAAANERKVGTPTTVAPLADYAAEIARRLLQWLDGASPPKQPPGKAVDSIDV